MKLPQPIVSFVLNSDNAKEAIKSQQEAIVNEAIKVLEEQKVEQRKEVRAELLKSRKYVVESSQTKISANDHRGGRDPGALWGLYSNVPGSVQCASKIIEAVVGGGYVIEPETGKKGTKKDLRTLIEFFDRPNPDDTIETLAFAGIENYLAYGDWYMEKVATKGTAKSKNPRIAELYNMNSAEMSILVDPDKKKRGILEKVGYRRMPDYAIGQGIVYTPQEVMQIRRPSSTAGVYGKAVLEKNEAITQLLLRAVQYNTSVLRNGGRPPLQITLPEDSTEADAQSVSAYYETNFQGEANAGKALILFKGAEAKPLGISPQDMAYLELIMMGIKLTAGQYGVPLLLINFPEGSNRAVASEVRRNFYYTTINPLRKLIASKFTHEVIKQGLGIEGWKFDFRSQGLEESESSKRDTMTAMSKGMMDWNEGRVKMGLLPLAEEWANKFYLLSSKNDSLMPVLDAIGAKTEDSEQDVKEIGGGTNPGEGADTQPSGDPKEGDDNDKER